jgi:transaldolase
MTSPTDTAAPSVGSLQIKVFADGADIDDIKRAVTDPLIAGFTTNPTLMRKAGVLDYVAFARSAVEVVDGRPISFEVFADEPIEMERQARQIASWGPNVYVKVPVTTCDGTSTAPLVRSLAGDGVQLNVTALMTPAQVAQVAEALDVATPAIVSVFAGRIADTGRDPIPLMEESLAILGSLPNAELLWASPREVLNILQADAIGCHIVTVTQDLLDKLGNVGKSLDQFSLETVEMFFRDAASAGYSIAIDGAPGAP